MSGDSRHIQTDDLSAFIDGVFDVRHRATIEEHLVTCVDCRKELAELRATVRLLHSLPQLAPRKSFQLGSGFATVQQAQGRVVSFLPKVRALSVAAVIALLVMSGAYIFDSSTREAQPQNRAISAVNGGSGQASSETETASGSSQGEEDANINLPAAAPSQNGETQPQRRRIDRGDAAAAGDGPLEAIPTTDESPATESAGVGNADQAADSRTVAQNPPVSSGTTRSTAATPGVENHRIPWGALTLALGGLSAILVGLWITLTRIGRSSVRRDS